ncbi:hypothetical protein BLNAU_22629 [Blattamonas nauphoetae]|uniref:Transmembrane protein n=1 Tax=Blattamonas nauphoetae TaxID=2049346 RepID=A0ABQ9WSG5_9EUKA|nr:hypothetical protein BLNAU_22629 [Blattamonas nauphoetae]
MICHQMIPPARMRLQMIFQFHISLPVSMHPFQACTSLYFPAYLHPTSHLHLSSQHCLNKECMLTPTSNGRHHPMFHHTPHRQRIFNEKHIAMRLTTFMANFYLLHSLLLISILTTQDSVLSRLECRLTSTDHNPTSEETCQLCVDVSKLHRDHCVCEP